MYVHRLDDIGALIRDRRQEKGWTQARLAEAVGVPRKTIVRLENATHASRVDLVLAALNALNVRLWADIGDGAPIPGAVRSDTHDAVDMAAIVDDMLDNL